jgi:Tfp pilus assembly protein PilO
MTIAPVRQNEKFFYFASTLVGVAVWGGVLFVFFLIVFRPLVAADSQNREDALHLESLLAASGEVYVNHQRLKGELASLHARIDSTAARVPDTAEESRFLNQITQLAAETGVELNDYQQLGSVTLVTHSTTTIGIKCQSEYATLCKFLDGVAKLPRMTMVSKLRIDVATPGAPLQVELHYVLYYGIAANPLTNEAHRAGREVLR